MSKPTWSNALGCSATSVFFGRLGGDARGAADRIVIRNQFAPVRSRSPGENRSLRNYER
jgi:hypothetical protein